jgi:catechol 2,3-dioxygenase
MSGKVRDVRQFQGVPAPGRLPEQTHVGAVHLQIGDLQRSVDYYQAVLGMDVLERGAGRASLGVRGATPLAYLVEKKAVAPAPRRGRFGLYHFALLLPDRAALGRFTAHVLRLGLRPGMADHSVSEALYLSDPDGLGIEVYADRPRASWTHQGDELVMTTDPLDVGSLITASEGEDWDAAPAGTTMGHVHLHVGDLPAAEAFYHRALGFDKKVWSFPGALFFSAGGYHHHLGTNIWSPGPSARADEAKLLAWELVVPDRRDAYDVAQRLRTGGYAVDDAPEGVRASDPWGSQVYVSAPRAGLEPASAEASARQASNPPVNRMV